MLTFLFQISTVKEAFIDISLPIIEERVSFCTSAHKKSNVINVEERTVIHSSVRVLQKTKLFFFDALLYVLPLLLPLLLHLCVMNENG